MANGGLTAAQALQRAIESHKAGNLPEAERLYRAILHAHPSHAAANHYLGCLAVDLGKAAEALPCFEAALRAAPQQQESWLSYVDALARCGRLADARRALAQARACGLAAAPLDALEERLPREPSPAEAGALQRAFAARSFTDLERAARPLTEAYPRSALGWKALGLALLAMQRTQESLPVLERSIALAADDPEVHGYLADACRRLGLAARAEAAFRQVIALRPGSADAHLALGNLLFTQDRFHEAEEHLRRSIEAKPAAANAHASLGATLRQLGRFDEAERCFREAVALDPGDTDHHYNLGNLLREIDRLADAEAPYRRALERDPDNRLAMNNLADTLLERERFAEALDLYRRALVLKPDYATARWNKSLLDLRLGDFAEGWRGYEWRWRWEGFPTPRRDLPQPLWLGDEPVTGKTVAVHWEQGLGDTIQFCRYLRLLEERGAKVLFAPQQVLRGLMKGLLPDTIELVDLRDLLEGRATFDCQVPLISLPLAFATAVDSIPNAVPYLRADPARVEHWRDRVGGHGFKVGICWQGNTGRFDRGRSFPLASFAGISRLPGVRLINLHKGAGLAQLSSLPDGMHVETLGDAFDGGPDAFIDTAAVMTLCDLVITSDTAVAHLGGALGVRTWVALKAVPDWRWLRDRTDSPWYPTLRLFRQKSRGEWTSVFSEIEAELGRVL
jgi:tetratricopeptide (TPR) repeat protein